MPSVEECIAYAAEYKTLAADPRNSARQSAVLTHISRSWATLAHQLEDLAIIERLEGPKDQEADHGHYRTAIESAREAPA